MTTEPRPPSEDHRPEPGDTTTDTATVPPGPGVGPRFVVPFALAQLGLFVALLAPVNVSMALKVTAVVGDADAAGTTGLVLGVGAVAALLGNPVFGRLSDRTTSRWGRRRPWMVGGVLGLAACLLLIAVAQNVALLMVGWFLAQLGANAAFAAFIATIADHVPARQSASITALAGVMQNVGILVAVYVAAALTGDLLALFMVPAAIAVVTMLAFALVLPDPPLTTRPASEGLLTDLTTTFWVSPRRHPDFGWAWLSRFLFILGMYLFMTFRLFWITDEIGLDQASAADAVATGVLVYTVGLVVFGQIAGWVSDRLQRRKAIIFASTVLFAIGLGLLIGVDTLGGFYVVEAILGAAYGIYLGVDLALVMQVLPRPEDAAKDLGVFNIAIAGPQSLAPLLGAGLLAIGGGGNNYTVLYMGAAAVTVIGALAVLPVRSVR